MGCEKWVNFMDILKQKDATLSIGTGWMKQRATKRGKDAINITDDEWKVTRKQPSE
jgi:hypothetical protein